MQAKDGMAGCHNNVSYGTEHPAGITAYIEKGCTANAHAAHTTNTN